MPKRKTAILFYGKNKVPTPFDEYKKYEVRTGYVALYDKQDNYCALCRILDERELSLHSSSAYKLILKRDDTHDIDELRVIVIGTDFDDIPTVDRMMKRVFDIG